MLDNLYTFCMHLYRNKVSAAILDLCKTAMRKTKELRLDWLCVLPLCHFMSGSCEPYSSLEYNPEKIKFSSRAKKFGYDDIQWKHLSGYGGIYILYIPMFINFSIGTNIYACRHVA